MAVFHYSVKIKIIDIIKGNGEISFEEFEKKFENENPIIARDDAFEYCQNYVDVLLQDKGEKDISYEKTREHLSSFFDAENSIKIGEVEFKSNYGNGIGVYLVVNQPIYDESLGQHQDEAGEEYLIHGIGNFFSFHNRVMSNLDKEYEYYKYYGYDTANKITEIVFCDSEEWAEGYLEDGKWEEGYFEPNTHKILKTPFDWTGYDKPYWWDKISKDESDKSQKRAKELKKIIEEGESEYVEFKPALLYNFSTGKAGIGIKGIIAKAICAFLNSKGGFLIIGVSDERKPQGLSYDFSLSEGKNEKDFFKLEFDQMLEYFLSFSVKNNVSGDFFRLEDKDIFVVTVMPSKRRPIFLKGQNGKEFYVRGQASSRQILKGQNVKDVRGEASSRQIIDIEELVNYCIDKWG